MIALTIYSRPGCHLCDEMKAVLQRVAQTTTAAISIEEIDITADPALEARYGLEIPVLVIDGRKVAKYRITAEQLMRVVRDRSGGSGG